MHKQRLKNLLAGLGLLILGCYFAGFFLSFDGGYHTDRFEFGRGVMFGAIAAAHVWVLAVGIGFWFIRTEKHLFLTIMWLFILSIIVVIDVQSVRGY